jgi:predicted ferric reductase
MAWHHKSNMVEVLWKVASWSVVYLLVALLPLGVAMFGGTREERGFWVEFGVGLGIVGFAMLALQFLITGRFRWVASYFGADAKIQFHREAGIMAVVLVLAHPIVLLLAEPRYLEFLNPWLNLPRALFLSGAIVALIFLVVLSLWRVSLGISYEWWRVTHGGLALVVTFVGLVHALQVGHYVTGIEKQAVWVTGTGAALGLLVYTRLVKPLKGRRNPYRVVEVRPDCQGVYSLVLEPIGHAGMTFRAGQYAWLTVGDSPLTLQQHPFSLASSAATPGRIEFGIKEFGDFTATIKDLPMETQVFVEGPYGAFTFDSRAHGAVFVVGGIGITPALSILRTCRDRQDRRPLLLIYANNQWDDIAFRDELDDLSRRLALEIVHVLATPPEGWTGESGFVTEELLARHLSKRKEQDLQYFVCGPAAMMDVVERTLVAQGVPLQRLLSERFDLV